MTAQKICRKDVSLWTWACIEGGESRKCWVPMKAAAAAIVSMSWMVLSQIVSYCPSGMLPLNWYKICFIVFWSKYRIKTCAPRHYKFSLNLVWFHFTWLSMHVILGKTCPLLQNRCIFCFLIMPNKVFASMLFNREIIVLAETGNYRCQYCFHLWGRNLKSTIKTHKINRLKFFLWWCVFSLTKIYLNSSFYNYLHIFVYVHKRTKLHFK